MAVPVILLSFHGGNLLKSAIEALVYGRMGEVFSVMIRKRWFTRRHIPAFSPISDVEYLQDDWLDWRVWAGSSYVQRSLVELQTLTSE